MLAVPAPVARLVRPERPSRQLDLAGGREPLHGRGGAAVEDRDHRGGATPRTEAMPVVRLVVGAHLVIQGLELAVPHTTELVERAAAAQQLALAARATLQVAAEVVEAAGLDPAVTAPAAGG